MNKRIIITKNRHETQRIAVRLARETAETAMKKSARVIALSGNLGSGKTTFVQGFTKGLGIKEIPKSPTFILMQIFNKPTTNNSKEPSSRALGQQQTTNLIHIDAYRLEKPKELLHLGFKEILRDPHNIVVIEWAEKVKKLLPQNTMWIKFEHAGKNKRLLRVN